MLYHSLHSFLGSNIIFSCFFSILDPFLGTVMVRQSKCSLTVNRHVKLLNEQTYFKVQEFNYILHTHMYCIFL